ncbi:F0F1 ATP synthase subunit gamma [Labrys okinawensis]|uniref:F0F1 ATP synthase subunit gamma n=1 Tax=Labrys okinawensis TaxID=346911 RepID=UPI0039BD7660
MPSLKDLRNRIASVKATQKITKAMQMVAAAKLRRAQSAAEAARPYAERVDAVLANLAGSIADPRQAPPLLAGNGKDQTHLLVVCTGERGLCGAFNTSIARLAREHVMTLLGQGKTVKILCVGRKGYDVLKRQYEKNIIELVDFRAVRTLGFEQADLVGSKIRKLYADGEFDVCTLFFSTFKSVISQIPTAKRLIPAEVPERDPKASESGQKIAYEYEPDETAILAELLPRNISVQVLRALLENNASFYGSQMSAMDNATRNAGEMIKKQTITYNRTRQAMITKELIEIISGAEAL